jgi:tetratricopeptide (TPR) repeat protein
MNIKILFLMLVLSLLNNAWATDKSADKDEMLFTLAHKLFQQSIEENNVNTETSRHFEVLSKTYPNNPLFLAYQGSLYTLIAQNAWLPWSKSRYISEASKRIKEALEILKSMPDRKDIESQASHLPISVETRLIAVSAIIQMDEIQWAKAVLYDLFRYSEFINPDILINARIRFLAAKVARHNRKFDEEKRHLEKINEKLELNIDFSKIGFPIFAEAVHKKLKERIAKASTVLEKWNGGQK